MKIFHLQLVNYNNNQYTLVCNLLNGSLNYTLYQGWGSSGIPCGVESYLQVGFRYGSALPLETLEGETKEDFTERVINIINDDSVLKVVKKLKTDIQFA